MLQKCNSGRRLPLDIWSHPILRYLFVFQVQSTIFYVKISHVFQTFGFESLLNPISSIFAYMLLFGTFVVDAASQAGDASLSHGHTSYFQGSVNVYCSIKLQAVPNDVPYIGRLHLVPKFVQ